MGDVLHLESSRQDRQALDPDDGPEPLWRHVLGEQMRRARHDRGLTQAASAARAGISPQYLSEIERGCKDPSSEIVAAVAGALRLSVSELTRRAVAAMPAPALPLEALRLPSSPISGPVALAA